MPLVIIPGIHSSQLSDRFIDGIRDEIKQDYLILPTQKYPPYSGRAVYQWLEQQQLDKVEPLTFIAFSAGVVGGITAAIAWQLRVGKIHGFVAFDGWGMPLMANFPIYRVSHDYFTHWSSGILGSGEHGFYADPRVSHLELWRSPNQCSGWYSLGRGLQSRCSLTDYLNFILNLTSDQ
ncbi:MAG: hypothetical protein AAF383_11890 [Cyanobacteria bacterium P01_A01_bin.83]